MSTLTTPSIEFVNNIEKITHLNLVQFIDEFNKAKINIKSKKELKLVKNSILIAIQKMVSQNLKQIEENIPKYWSSNKEDELIRFLNSCKNSWEELKEILPTNDKSILKWITTNIENILQQFKKQRLEIEYSDLFEDIEKNIKYWPFNKATRILEIADKLVQDKEAVIKKLIQIHILNTTLNIERIEDLKDYELLPKRFTILTDKICPIDLLNAYEIKLKKLKFKSITLKVKDYFEELEKGIVGANYWNSEVECKLIKLIIYSNDSSYKLDHLKYIYRLFKLFKSNDSTSIFEKLPELKNTHKSTKIRYSQDGSYSLYSLGAKDWIPAYKWENDNSFPDLVFKQEGEWKHRKFKCSSWYLNGRLPVGTILRMMRKKDVEYYIVSAKILDESSLRDIELESYEIERIKSVLNKTDKNGPKLNIHTLNKKELNEIFGLLFDSNLNAKIGINIYSKDKFQETYIYKLFFSVFTGITKKNKSNLPLNNFKSLFSKNNDKKYLSFFDKMVKTNE